MKKKKICFYCGAGVGGYHHLKCLTFESKVNRKVGYFIDNKGTTVLLVSKLT